MPGADRWTFFGRDIVPAGLVGLAVVWVTVTFRDGPTPPALVAAAMLAAAAVTVPVYRAVAGPREPNDRLRRRVERLRLLSDAAGQLLGRDSPEEALGELFQPGVGPARAGRLLPLLGRPRRGRPAARVVGRGAGRDRPGHDPAGVRAGRLRGRRRELRAARAGVRPDGRRPAGRRPEAARHPGVRVPPADRRGPPARHPVVRPAGPRPVRRGGPAAAANGLLLRVGGGRPGADAGRGEGPGGPPGRGPRAARDGPRVGQARDVGPRPGHRGDALVRPLPGGVRRPARRRPAPTTRSWPCSTPDDRERVRLANQAAFGPDGPHQYDTEYRVERPDGTVRWVAAMGRALPDATGRGPPADRHRPGRDESQGAGPAGGGRRGGAAGWPGRFTTRSPRD